MMDWVQLLTATGAIGAMFTALGVYIKTRPAMKLAQMEAEGPLWAEIHSLRAEQKREREECRQEIARLSARVADLQHDLTNETTSFDSFLLMAESDPAKVLEQIPRIKDMRAQHKQRMALKKGQREGAIIANSTTGEA